MTEIKITLQMPDEVYNQIKHQAEQSHRPIDAYLGERLALWLFPSRSQTAQPTVSGKGDETLLQRFLDSQEPSVTQSAVSAEGNEALQHAIEEVKAAFAQAGAEQSTEVPAGFTQAIIGLPALSDDALWRAARTRISQRASARLQMLHEKRQREGLDDAETQEAARLTRQYERALFVRAHAATLLKQRGFDVSMLLASA